MDWDNRRREQTTDITFALGLLMLSIGSVLFWQQDPGDGVRPLDVFGYILIAGQTLPIVWRRRYPVAVLAIIVGVFMIDRGFNYPSSWAFLGISLAIYTVGAQLPPKRSLIVGAVAIDVVLLWTLVGVITFDVPLFAVVSEIAVLGFPFLVGRETHFRERRMVELETRALQAEHQREQEAADAVLRERTRIARELHDVVAHEITVMTIQSAAARRVLSSDPNQADVAIKTVEEAGHRALTEIRRMLGMLRTSDARATNPQPGLSELNRLVAQMNDAGVPTTLAMSGETRPLPLGVDLNAYRIIQESLTNTLKHGGPDVHAEVRIEFNDDTLEIEVLDNGRGAAALRAVASAQQGLIGMHERAALLDGVLHTGPRPGGGYRVNARIPIPTR